MGISNGSLSKTLSISARMSMLFSVCLWFPIVYGNNSRYVHVGNLSDGCTTVVDLALWGEVFEALISHRGKDGQSVGVLVVEGKPAREK
jgi:hypothetical protein